MKRLLKVVGIVLGVVLVLVLALIAYVQLAWDKADKRTAHTLTAPHDSATIARGEYIYKTTWQCWGCHTSTDDAGAPPSGGRVFDLRNVGPGFGLFYSRNITPDPETGIGSWTDGEIVQAIREGVRKDRTPLFPLMPVDWLKNLSDEDALALVAYLRSLPPIKNRVPEARPSFIAKALFAFKIIKPLDVIAGPVAAPPQGVTPEYGKYVATSLAGCADCHTPRNLQNGKFYMDSLFAGSTIAFGAPEGLPLRAYARNIRPNGDNGIGSWTEEQFIMAVTTGMRPDGTVLTPHMPYPQFKFMADDDIRAVYLYLKSLPPMPRSTPPVEVASSLSQARGTDRGKMLFHMRCQSCHGVDAGGARPTNVVLAEVASSLTDDELVDFIGGGQLNLKMPAFGKTLSREELKDIVAYLRTVQR